MLAGHGARIVVANSMQVKAIAHARVKTDKIDAHILAQLLRADFIPQVAMPEPRTWELRQLMTHRQLLARHRTAARNAVCGILNRKLLKPPLKELFGPSGRRWLLAQRYTDIERLMLDNDLAHLDALETRLRTVDTKLIELASDSLDVKLLMSLPGVNVTVAIGLMAAIGDIARFDSPQKLTAYFGLVPRVYQSAESCHHGRITKQGRSQARWLAVEAAQSMVNSGAPLTASYHRIRRKKTTQRRRRRARAQARGRGLASAHASGAVPIRTDQAHSRQAATGYARTRGRKNRMHPEHARAGLRRNRAPRATSGHARRKAGDGQQPALPDSTCKGARHRTSQWLRILTIPKLGRSG